jgi:hypothetical protein
MTESEIKAVCRQWAELVTDLDVIYAGDDEPTAPRPNADPATLTYVAIDLQSSESKWSTYHEELTDEPAPGNKFEQHRGAPLEGVLAVAVYGPGAMDYTAALRRSVGREDVLSQLLVAGDFAIELPGQQVADATEIRSATREPGASAAFLVKWTDTEIHELEATEQIESTVEVDEE